MRLFCKSRNSIIRDRIANLEDTLDYWVYHNSVWDKANRKIMSFHDLECHNRAIDRMYKMMSKTKKED